MGGSVAFLARNTGVTAFQLVPGELVIEFVLGRFPVNQMEVLAIVLQVAAHAIPAIRIGYLQPAVVTVVIGEIFGDFLVTVGALKRGSAGAKLMTTRALRCAA
jgi:hypothetical protein